MQQAAKDYEMAEFYRRRDHPCSAYFYYEIVRRRYQGTKYADLATERIRELGAELEKSSNGEKHLELPMPGQQGILARPGSIDEGPIGSSKPLPPAAFGPR